MSKEQKMNKRLHDAKMKEKFRLSFQAVNIGMTVVAVIAIANLFLLAKAGGISIFSSFSRIVGFLLLLVAVFLNFSLLKVVARSLSAAIEEPISQLQDAVEKISNGEFEVNIEYDSQDEFGELVMNLNQACIKVHSVLEDAGYCLGEMAEGNFEVSSKTYDSYVGDFQSLIEAMRKLKYQMTGTLRQIRVSSEQVMVGSEHMASSAQDLAEGATSQAGAVEELNATIESVTNISSESASNAVMAAKNASEAAEEAKGSREEMNQLTAAMERINETSREIENIIAAIEDIASQTNLLSLNASIEAARAGEAGRGFAVVADQIGNLATDSAQSAVTTRELISKCLVEVETGNSIVEKTMDSINSVLENMENFATMAAGAADSSKTQLEMLEQIQAGIEQITEVVQNNSAAAQETSALSEELSAQATNLEELVQKFVLAKEK